MNFESLPNEMLLELFEFFNGVHLFRTFYNLNIRFNTLLIVHFQRYHFDFRNISKGEFDRICGNQLLSITDRIISLCLSDDNETPNLLDQFHSYGFTLTQFTNLRSLSLVRIRPQKKLDILLTESLCLPNLTHLTITECYWGNENDFIGLINSVWSLSKLTHCILRGNSVNGDLTRVRTVKSPS
jgi:hypothetical protein